MTTQTLELRLSLSDEVLGYLQSAAQRRRIPLEEVVSEVLEDYFDEPTNEEILESIREGMEQALAGNVRPAHEVLDEIEREIGDDADNS